MQDLCKEDKVFGAVRFGRAWMIPVDAIRPEDGRKKEYKKEKYRPLFKKTPFLDMTDLYNKSGAADECIAALADFPEEQLRFAAEIAYSRGEIDKVIKTAQELMENKTGLYAVISSSILLSLCAMWKGDIVLWNKAKMHFLNAPCVSDSDRDIIEFSITCAKSAVLDMKDYPEWFTRGCFDKLPKDSHPAARVYYVKYLMILAQELAMGSHELDDMKGLGFMKSLPYILEPMITQAYSANIIMEEIYLRLLCAAAYYNSGNMRFAKEHLDRVIKLCLADGLYGPLAEHRRFFGFFLDERIGEVDQEALKRVKSLHKQLHAGWVKIHNIITNSKTSASLSMRELEVASLVSFGLNDSQIAARLSLSEHTVRSLINSAKNKTGVRSRYELAEYI